MSGDLVKPVRLVGGGVMCVRLNFFVWFTGILIRNVNTCNYNNQTGLVIITPCGHWSNAEEAKRGFASAFSFVFIPRSSFPLAVMRK